ncbi:MAG: rod shape-determining protein MreD [Bacteroidota bacterium]|nr:MAG: rod shape-determining protein MreD [Bacteroidota bacterium]
MIKRIPRNIIRFFVLILMQVLIFNNIELGKYLNPYFYVLFILLLPFETPGWLVLISGFFLGLSVDILSETLGMHTAASVFMAYLRPTALAMVSPRDGYETGTYPRVFFYGIEWFVQYALILVFAHHTVLFLCEMFSFRDLFHVILRIVLSTAFSVLLISLSQYLVYRK